MNETPLKVYESPGTEDAARAARWATEGLPLERVSERKEADLILTDGRNSEHELQSMKFIPREILMVRHVDLIDRRDPKKPWPRSLLTGAIKHAVLKTSRGLDQRGWAFTTGVSPVTRAAILAMFELGYRQVKLIHLPDEEPGALKIQEDCAKFCFGLTIEKKLRSELTLQANSGSLLVNVENLEADADLLQTLLYLNFLHRPGLVVDLSPDGEASSTLLKEADISGFGTVSHRAVALEWDREFREYLGLKSTSASATSTPPIDPD